MYFTVVVMFWEIGRRAVQYDSFPFTNNGKQALSAFAHNVIFRY